jgi:protein-S-isoprenylcysteine O-methyltransferase Ste14
MTLPITITPRQLVAAVGVLLAVAGLVVLLWPVHAVMDTGPFGLSEQVSCGNALITEDPYGTSGRDACSSALSDRRAVGAPMAVGGLIVAVVALFVNVSPQAREDA